MSLILYVGSKRYSSWSLRPYLALAHAGASFETRTIADAMFAPVTTRFTTYGVELDAPCRACVDAIAALPAMQAWPADAEREPREAV